MALLRGARSFCTSLLNRSERPMVSGYRSLSSQNGREEAVVVTDDGRTIVCWHPEPKVPYHLSKPLPAQPEETNSVLKVQDNKELRKLFSKQHPYFINKELRELTFTTKHPWFPRPGKRFAKKNPPKDREYL